MKIFGSKRLRLVTQLFVAIIVGSFATGQTSARSMAVEPIRCSVSSSDGLSDVWDRYVEGLRKGDTSRLRSVFADQGTFHRLTKPSGSGAENVSAQPFSEAIPVWAINPDTDASGILGSTTVDYNMATIWGTLEFGTDRFTDVLSLYCANGQWQIVSKLTYGQISQNR